MSAEICIKCGKLISGQVKHAAEGGRVCTRCKTNIEAKKMLDLLPSDSDPEWADLTEWEQGFLPSMRRQFDTKGTITENQFQSLERIYKRLG